jgi:DNA primase
MNELLIALVNSVLGTGKKTAGGNFAYICPYCNHHKPKLEINLSTDSKHTYFHCWSCDIKGKSVIPILRKVNAPQDKIEYAKTLVVDSSYNYVEKTYATLSLPTEFISLSSVDTPTISMRHAQAYIKNRGINKHDILQYNIGMCESGLYKNMIILPTYDVEGNLNYFTARSFEQNPYNKYRNPSVSRDIIVNEHFINWNIPVILCEGIFDAIAIKRNAIPLLGKSIQNNLMKKLITSMVDKVYIALDSDAVKQSLRFCEKLMAEGKEVYLVDLQDKDPSSMGFKAFTKLIQNTFPLTYSQLLSKKLSL